MTPAPPLATWRSSALTSCRSRWAASSAPGWSTGRRARVDHQDQDELGRLQQRNGVAGGARGLARAVPGDDGAPRRQRGRTCARDHQRRPAAVHERGLDQRRVVDAVRREVGLADDGQVGAAGVARQQVRQPVQRAALRTGTSSATPCRSACRPGRGQHRLGLGLGVRQVLAQQLGRQMAAAHPGRNGSAIR